MGSVFQYVDHIATQEQRNVQLVFANLIGDKIGDGPNGLPLSSAITGVDDNDSNTNKTDAHEDPNYGADNSCKDCGDRSDNSLEDVEA